MADVQESEQYLTVREACRILKISDKSLYLLINRGDLKASRIAGRPFRIRPSDIDAYIEECRVNRPPRPGKPPGTGVKYLVPKNERPQAAPQEIAE